MTLRKEPSEERLLAYAAGTLSPPQAVVVATHLAMRPKTDAFILSASGLSFENRLWSVPAVTPCTAKRLIRLALVPLLKPV